MLHLWEKWKVIFILEELDIPYEIKKQPCIGINRTAAFSVCRSFFLHPSFFFPSFLSFALVPGSYPEATSNRRTQHKPHLWESGAIITYLVEQYDKNTNLSTRHSTSATSPTNGSTPQ
jgi:hypothetical protein